MWLCMGLSRQFYKGTLLNSNCSSDPVISLLGDLGGSHLGCKYSSKSIGFTLKL